MLNTNEATTLTTIATKSEISVDDLILLVQADVGYTRKSKSDDPGVYITKTKSDKFVVQFRKAGDTKRKSVGSFDTKADAEKVKAVVLQRLTEYDKVV